MSEQPGKVRVTEESLRAISDYVVALVLRKNADYGDAWQSRGGVGWAIRLSDKLVRVENLMDGRQALVLNENIQDSLIDAIGYSLLGLLWLDEQDFPGHALLSTLEDPRFT